MGRIVTAIATAACVLAGVLTVGLVRLDRAAGSGPVAERRVAAVELERDSPEMSVAADAEIARLTAAATDAGVRLERVRAAQLAELEDAGFDAWILAGEARLSDDDCAVLDRFALAGGGLLLTGAAATADAEGRPREELPLERLFPGQRFEPAGAGPVRLRAGARGIALAALEPGAPLDVSEGAGLRSLDGGQLVEAAHPERGALLTGEHHSAPVAWLGVAAHTLDPAADAVLANLMRWVAGLPVVELRPWPRGHRSAAVVGIEIGPDPTGAEATARELADDGVAAVLAMTPAVAESDPDRTRRMARLGDIALALDVETTLPAEGRARLERTARGSVSGAVGRVPEGRVAHLSASGYRWAVQLDRADLAPRLANVVGETLVELPGATPGPDTAATGDAVTRLLAAQERAGAADGLFHARLDPGWARDSDAPPAGTLIDELRQRDVWLAAAPELARWWRARSGVRAHLETLAPGRARLELGNGGELRAGDLAIRVYLPARARPAGVKRVAWWGPDARFRLARDRSWVELFPPALDPGDSVEYILTF